MATALLVTLVVVVVGAGGGGLLRRRLADERTSVRDYQQALDTLRHMSARRAETDGVVPRPASSRNGIGAVSPEAGPSRARAKAGAASRNGAGAASRNGGRSRSRTTPATRRTEVLVSAEGARSARGRRSSAAAFRSGSAPVTTRVDAPAPDLDDRPPVPAGAASTVTGPETDDAAVATPPARTAADAVRELAAARALHGPRPARPSMPSRHRTGPSRSTLLTVAAVVVVGVVTGVAVALGPSHRGAPRSPAAHAAAPPTSVVHHVASRAPKPKTSTGGSSSSSAALTPVTTSGSAATYQVGTATFTLTLAADGACWVEAKDPSTGQVLWSGTLQAGQTQQVPGSGQLVVRLGDARNVTVTVGGRQVALPPGFDSVVDLTFQTV